MERRTEASQADAAALESQELLNSLLSSSPDAIFFASRDGTIARWSEAAEALYGWRPDEIAGQHVSTLFAPGREDDASALLDPEVETQARIQTVGADKDGARFHVEMTSARVRGVEGSTAGFALIARETTEAMLHEGAASAASSLEASEGLAAFGAVLADVIPFRLLALYGIDNSSVRFVASAGEARATPIEHAARLLAGALGVVTDTRAPLVVSDTRSERFSIDARLAEAGISSYIILPLEQGRGVFAALLFGFAETDALTPKMIERLSSAAVLIAHPMANLLTFVDQAAALRELEKVDALKNEFLALITHDIRTPLSVIAGFAETLRGSWSDLPEQEKLEGLDAILRNGKNLSRLVEEGLQVAMVESGDLPYTIEPFDLGDLVRRTATDYVGLEDPRRLNISVPEVLPPAVGDEQRTWQVLTNLISNAIKFSPPYEPIDVEVTRQGPMLQVAVRDRGVGISSEDLPKLFHKFYRAGTNDELRKRGTGLGLYLCKAMVEMQRGRIWVESKLGEGSTFMFTLPVGSQ